MTVISAGIVNRQGKIILSRQFTDISRIRIEGLLSAFPKLLGSGTQKQCTFLEAGAIRYVYQPIEELLLVLVTSKSSNIVEDLATLRLMGRLIPEYVSTVDEEHVLAKAFDVLFAFDEVIVGGNRENNTIEQIMTYLEMQSHEEEVAKEEKRMQMELAKKEARRRAHEINQKKRESGYSGIGSHGSGGGVGSTESGSSAGPTTPAEVSTFRGSAVQDEPVSQKPKSVGGMSLGKARKTDAAVKVLQEAGAPIPQQTATAQASAGGGGGAATSSSTGGGAQDGIHIKCEERISATLNRDGGATNVDVRGDLYITVADAQLASVRLLLSRFSDDFSYKTHPNINKNIFTSDRVLTIRDGKPYPTHQTLGILRWRLQNPGRVRAPISITCWPGDSNATVEFELDNLQATLSNVVLTIPLGGANIEDAQPSIGDFSVSGDNLLWKIPVVDSSNSSGSLEITLGGAAGPKAFFPMDVQFAAGASVAGLQVVEVVSTETGVPVRFSSETQLLTEDYKVN